MMDLKIPNYQPLFDYFDLGKGKVIKKIGFKGEHDQVFVFGDIKSGNFMAIYGNNNKGRLTSRLNSFSKNGCRI
jgi:hypothetical protein